MAQIDLGNNMIASLPKSAFAQWSWDEISGPLQVTLSGNPLDCSCCLRWLKETPSVTLASGTCSTPAELEGTPLTIIPSSELTCPNDPDPWDHCYPSCYGTPPTTTRSSGLECPPQALIEPCFCFFTEGNDYGALYCLEQSSEVFIDRLLLLSVDLRWRIGCDRCDITDLPKRVFGHVPVELVLFRDTPIVNIATDAFEGQEMTLSVFGIVQSAGLNHIPTASISTLEKLRILYLPENGISRIPSEAFKGTSLQQLDLTGNPLSQISDGAFVGVEDSMFSLTVSQTSLTELNPEAFAKARNLSDLIASNSLISELYDDNFQNTKLSVLDLSNNRLSQLPMNTLRGLENTLTILRLELNDIPTLHPETLQGLSLLGGVSLSSNRLSSIPGNAFLGTGIQVMYIDNNRLNFIDTDAFAGLNNTLSRLYLHSNEIENIADFAFVNLVALENLGLENNQMTTIGRYTFAGMNGLQELRLQENKIVSIEAGAFSDLTSMTLLYLQKNAIQEIAPGTFNGLQSLINLEMSENFIKTLASGAFSGLNSLTSIFLEGNLLQSLGPGVFKDLPLLYAVVLKNNQLKVLDAIFDNTSAVFALDASDNQLHTICDGVFNEMPLFSSLAISNNNLTTLRREAIKNEGEEIIRLQLTMLGNPLHCDCCIGWIAEETAVTVLDPVTCASPPSLSGTPLSDLDENDLTCSGSATCQPLCGQSQTTITAATATSDTITSSTIEDKTTTEDNRGLVIGMTALACVIGTAALSIVVFYFYYKKVLIARAAGSAASSSKPMKPEFRLSADMSYNGGVDYEVGEML